MTESNVIKFPTPIMTFEKFIERSLEIMVEYQLSDDSHKQFKLIYDKIASQDIAPELREMALVEMSKVCEIAARYYSEGKKLTGEELERELEAMVEGDEPQPSTLRLVVDDD